MKVATYAGSFDPITRGHEDLILRSLGFVDRLVVAITTNTAKQPLFSIEERVEFAKAGVAALKGGRVDVKPFSGLLVNFAREHGATLVIRGLRAVADFEYEYQMALMNRHLYGELETLFMVPSIDLTYVSSSIVREVARFGGRTTDLVNPVVERALKAKFGGD